MRATIDFLTKHRKWKVNKICQWTIILWGNLSSCYQTSANQDLDSRFVLEAIIKALISKSSQQQYLPDCCWIAMLWWDWGLAWDPFYKVEVVGCYGMGRASLVTIRGWDCELWMLSRPGTVSFMALLFIVLLSSSKVRSYQIEYLNTWPLFNVVFDLE